MLVKELLDLLVVLLKQGLSLAFELSLDLCQLVRVVSTHSVELGFHAADQLVNVVVHFLHGLDVVLVLYVECGFELTLEFLLVLNDFLALNDLLLNVSSKLFAVFFLLKFLPVPVNFYVTFVGGDDFVLNLISSFLFQFFLLYTTSVFGQISIGFNLSDCEIGLSSNLFQVAYIC